MIPIDGWHVGGYAGKPITAIHHHQLPKQLLACLLNQPLNHRPDLAHVEPDLLIQNAVPHPLDTTLGRRRIPDLEPVRTRLVNPLHRRGISSVMGHRHELIRQSPDIMEITSRRLSNLVGRQPVPLPLVRLRLPLDLFLPLLITLVYNHHSCQLGNRGILGRVILRIQPPIIITDAQYRQPTDNDTLIFVVLQRMIQQINAKSPLFGSAP